MQRKMAILPVLLESSRMPEEREIPWNIRAFTLYRPVALADLNHFIDHSLIDLVAFHAECQAHQDHLIGYVNGSLDDDDDLAVDDHLMVCAICAHEVGQYEGLAKALHAADQRTHAELWQSNRLRERLIELIDAAPPDDTATPDFPEPLAWQGSQAVPRDTFTTFYCNAAVFSTRNAVTHLNSLSYMTNDADRRHRLLICAAYVEQMQRDGGSADPAVVNDLRQTLQKLAQDQSE